jgi:hypothetical protein
MTRTTTYTSPNIEVVEVEIERGFELSGTEIPDFDNENEI